MCNIQIYYSRIRLNWQKYLLPCCLYSVNVIVLMFDFYLHVRLLRYIDISIIIVFFLNIGYSIFPFKNIDIPIISKSTVLTVLRVRWNRLSRVLSLLVFDHVLLKCISKTVCQTMPLRERKEYRGEFADERLK